MNEDEYLQFLIDYHYSNYRDFPSILSIYDNNKKLRFTTKYRDEFLQAKQKALYGVTPLESTFNLAIDNLPGLAQAFEKILAQVISQQQTVSCVVFGRVAAHIGAVHILLEPILNHQQTICGVKSSASNSTGLFFGCNNWSPVNHSQNIHKIRILQALTVRQQDTLYLLALNFNLQEIAELFKISRGTVSKTLMHIAIKFGIESYSSQIVIDDIGASLILANLHMPNIDLPYRIIYFVHKSFTEYGEIHIL